MHKGDYEDGGHDCGPSGEGSHMIFKLGAREYGSRFGTSNYFCVTFYIQASFFGLPEPIHIYP